MATSRWSGSLGVLNPWASQVRLFLQAGRELNIHRDLNPIAGGFPVPLKGVAISQVQQRARMINRKHHGNACTDFIIVEVAPVKAGGYCRRREVTGGCD